MSHFFCNIVSKEGGGYHPCNFHIDINKVVFFCLLVLLSSPKIQNFAIKIEILEFHQVFVIKKGNGDSNISW